MEAGHARDCLSVCLYVQTLFAGMARTHKQCRTKITIIQPNTFQPILTVILRPCPPSLWSAASPTTFFFQALLLFVFSLCNRHQCGAQKTVGDHVSFLQHTDNGIGILFGRLHRNCLMFGRIKLVTRHGVYFR